MAARQLLTTPALAAAIGTGTTAPNPALTAFSLSASNAGQSFRIDPSTGAVACTLPALSTIAGCRWRVIKATAGANAITVTSPTAATVFGTCIGNAAVVTPAAGVNANIVAGAAAGAWMEIFCDGVTVQMIGSSNATAAGITVT